MASLESNSEAISPEQLNALFTQMSKMLEGTGMKVPPPIFNHMKGEPISKDLDSILVHAQLDSKTDKELHLSATVSSEVETETGIERTIHATATALQIILRKKS